MADTLPMCTECGREPAHPLTTPLCVLCHDAAVMADEEQDDDAGWAINPAASDSLWDNVCVGVDRD